MLGPKTIFKSDDRLAIFLPHPLHGLGGNRLVSALPSGMGQAYGTTERIKNKNRHAICRTYGNRQIFFMGNIGIRVTDSLSMPLPRQDATRISSPWICLRQNTCAISAPQALLQIRALGNCQRGVKIIESKINRAVTGQGKNALPP